VEFNRGSFKNYVVIESYTPIPVFPRAVLELAALCNAPKIETVVMSIL
jgi:hypothetical protein